MSRTIAATMAPGDGRRYRFLAAWCRPAAFVTALLPPMHHRVDAYGVVSVGLARPRSGGRTLAAVVLALPLVAAFGMLGEAAPWPVLSTAALLQVYVLSVSLCQGARDRADRPLSERQGLLRGPMPTASGWTLGRIRTDADAATAVRAVGDLLDAVVPAGETVQAFARSDREQAELELLGFAEPRGEHGPMVLVAPTTRG